MAANTRNPVFDLVTSTIEKQFENNIMPFHLFELEKAARTQAETSGWSEEKIINFILKWCRKYRGRYADEDVALAIRVYGVESSYLEKIAEKVAEKYGGNSIYNSVRTLKDEEIIQSPDYLKYGFNWICPDTDYKGESLFLLKTGKRQLKALKHKHTVKQAEDIVKQVLNK